MKNIAFILIFTFIPFTVFAGGQAQSGRDTNTNTIEGGQFVSPAMVDAYEYINDYVFPYDMNPSEDLSVFVKLEKGQVLSIGDSFNLLIGLRVNEQSFFSRNEGNFILFIHNPNVLLQPEWKNSIIAVLQRIRQAQQSDAVLGIFNTATNEIIYIPDSNAIIGALNQIQNTRKVFAIDAILDQSFRCMEAIGNSYNTRFFWMTDSDLLRSNNAAREREYFDFLINLQAQNNISFSYLGYGEVPNWATMNQSLKNAGGNTYFINSPIELEEEIWGDYDRFVYPTIENIKINLSLMPWITETRFDYRNEWYPVTNFTPVNANYTHTRSNNIKNMDADDTRIYLYYLRIGASIATAANQYYREISSNRIAPVGFVSVEYYSYTQGKTIYRVFPLQVRYTDDYDAYSAQIDHSVRKFTILQNTAFILKELSNLVNQRQYYTAILLVDSQIKLLESFLEEGPDDEISGDIETLTRSKTLLMEQARSLQYIR
ncbi:MAG: hypothetical protein LBI14_09770 [Treponema sp.]|nr:hypothetical protein [Treponema sp.]